MIQFLTLWRRELATYFLSPIGYVTICFFLLFMGFSFWSLIMVLAQGAAGVSLMKVLFGDSPFFWGAISVVVPLITMRLFSEEKKSGTIETLMTAPVSDVAVVLSKYFGALTFFVIMWLPTTAYLYVLGRFSPATPFDIGPMLTSYAGAFLLGAFYLSIGLFASSLTRNQVVAAFMSFAVICILFIVGLIPYFTGDPLLQHVGAYFSSVEHMLDFSRGIIDTRPIVLYLSSTALVLFATVRVIESRKWK